MRYRIIKKHEKIYTTDFKKDSLFDRLNFKGDDKFNNSYRFISF